MPTPSYLPSATTATTQANGTPYPLSTALLGNLGLYLQALAEQAPALASGQALVPAAAAGVSSTKAVTFPPGLFKTPPTVVVSGFGAASGATPIQLWVQDVTTTGCTVGANRGGAALPAYQVNWLATVPGGV